VSFALLEPAADALGELRESVVFLGGATIALWLTDPAARAPRVTYDVDVIAVEVTTLSRYESFQQRLRALDFSEDVESGVICRWRHLGRGIVLDAVPVDQRLAGFSGGWLSEAVADPAKITLPSGARISAVRPPWLIVTKLEAFFDRGGSDCLSSRDFEDIITLVAPARSSSTSSRPCPRRRGSLSGTESPRSFCCRRSPTASTVLCPARTEGGPTPSSSLVLSSLLGCSRPSPCQARGERRRGRRHQAEPLSDLAQWAYAALYPVILEP
jgi:hypothetical protein